MDVARAITGRTRLFAVLGDPVVQVQAPRLMNALFADLGHDAVLVPVQVSPAHLDTVVHGLRATGNVDGLLITVPHKVAVCRVADEWSTTVQLTGCANALRRQPDGRWLAENFDGAGFVSALAASGVTVTGRQVALVGVGGAGSAIAVALLQDGVRRLTVCDRDDERLRSFLARAATRWPGQVTGTTEPDLRGVDIAVNATPLGLRPGDPLPFDPHLVPRGATVADIIMEPAETALLRQARALGHRTQPGLPMLRHQLEHYRRFFGLDRVTARSTSPEPRSTL
ncbi:shikimate dehydrogenase family protein [Plantactinospora sp. CA-290183]|uniref:shikimate dehydrogenase family protein n=1 Tax=Plantactinospora sp. CA-290183 TaxID=3240006 RepID=UPI003D92B60E